MNTKSRIIRHLFCLLILSQATSCAPLDPNLLAAIPLNNGMMPSGYRSMPGGGRIRVNLGAPSWTTGGPASYIGHYGQPQERLRLFADQSRMTPEQIARARRDSEEFNKAFSLDSSQKKGTSQQNSPRPGMVSFGQLLQERIDAAHGSADDRDRANEEERARRWDVMQREGR